jgi:hypothetical protein
MTTGRINQISIDLLLFFVVCVFFCCAFVFRNAAECKEKKKNEQSSKRRIAAPDTASVHDEQFLMNIVWFDDLISEMIF